MQEIMIRKPLSNLSVPQIITQITYKTTNNYMMQTEAELEQIDKQIIDSQSLKSINDELSQQNQISPITSIKTSNYLLTVNDVTDNVRLLAKSRRPQAKELQQEDEKIRQLDDLDVHSVINERRPSKLKSSTTRTEYDQQFSSSQGTNIDELYVKPSEDTDEENSNKVVVHCTPVRDLEAEVKIYVDEDVEDNSTGSDSHSKGIISIIVDSNNYLENITNNNDENEEGLASFQIDDVVVAQQDHEKA